MNNIKIIRLARQLSQEQLAGKMQVGRSTVAMWETGGSNPANDFLVGLSNVLRASTDIIIGVIPCPRYNAEGWWDDEKKDYNSAHDDEERKRILMDFGVDQDHLSEFSRLFLDVNAKKTPIPGNGDGLNAEQAELVNLFEAASPELRAAALAVLKSAEEHSKAQGRASTSE